MAQGCFLFTHGDTSTTARTGTYTHTPTHTHDDRLAPAYTAPVLISICMLDPLMHVCVCVCVLCRFPGHPESVDALIVWDDSTLLTGSSDGMIRVVNILPNKLLGVVGAHEDMPIESLALSYDR